MREHLGFVSFSEDAEARLKNSLAELTLDGLELVECAEAFLLTACVVLPARASLERLVASLNRQALDALFTASPRGSPARPARPSTAWSATRAMRAAELSRGKAAQAPRKRR